jgi:hypothetical protein
LFIVDECEAVQKTMEPQKHCEVVKAPDFFQKIRLLLNICPHEKYKKLMSVGIPLLEEYLSVVSIMKKINFL